MGGNAAREELFGFGERGGLIAFEKEEVVGSFLLGQQSAVGSGLSLILMACSQFVLIEDRRLEN